MRLSFSFTETADISSLPPSWIFNTSIQIPDEALHLIGIEERILAVGQMVGTLTEASLHLTCTELDIKRHPIKLVDSTEENPFHISPRTTFIVFESLGQRTVKRDLKIRMPNIKAHPDYSPLLHERHDKSLKKNLHYRFPRTERCKSDDERQYVQVLHDLVAQLEMLLNAAPPRRGNQPWKYLGYHPSWWDNAMVDVLNRLSEKAAKEREKRQRQEEKLKAIQEQAGQTPALQTGAGRRPGAVPGVFKGVQFRSQLEIRFAAELEERGIQWYYETERLGDGNYLVDFYLPELKAWVEVKARFEPRDNYLLKDVAQYLKNERGERLFAYTQSKCYAVSPTRFTEMKHDKFWDRLLTVI